MVVSQVMGIVVLAVASVAFSGCVSESGVPQPVPASPESILQYCVEAADLGCARHACSIAEPETPASRCVYEVCLRLSQDDGRDCSDERCLAGVRSDRVEHFESGPTVDRGSLEFEVPDRDACASLRVNVEWFARPGPGSYELSVQAANGTEVTPCHRGQDIFLPQGAIYLGCKAYVPRGGPYELVWAYPGVSLVTAELIAIVDAPDPAP